MVGLFSWSFKASNDISQPNFPVLNCIKLSPCPPLPPHILLSQAKRSCCLTFCLWAFIYVHGLSEMCSLSSLLADILLVVLGRFQVPFLPFSPLLEVTSVALGHWWNLIQRKAVVSHRLLLPCSYALHSSIRLDFLKIGILSFSYFGSS